MANNRLKHPLNAEEVARSRSASALLDAVMAQLAVPNDAALAKVIGISATWLSKVRNGRLPVAPSILIRLHEETGLSIRDLKRYLDDDGAGCSSEP